MARYIKKGIKDPRFQYPNRYILSQIVGTQYDIIPYKGTKGVADAAPINEANMASIEDALVAIDTDLAFVEADYINAAEHALKQNIDEATLTTSSKTIPGAINELHEDVAFIEADYINAAEHALKQDKTDNNLDTADKTVVGAINELVMEKQDKTDSALNTSNKTVVGAINELITEKQEKNDTALHTVNKTVVGGINEIFDDYINAAEHALKQDKTDNALTTSNKTVVGAINEVKANSELYDAAQDDAIAIINNKVNALPMNGSLKNIQNSTTGIPTSFTNIDMFNTKQTVTNYQPLSLDYKGSAEPHVVLMKTIGDYIFDFAIEAAHTNGTDTTITLEAWVDGVLYDTATRTLTGASNQVNGITGFFSYSKGTDTAPSEIYFKFKASQGNTSANKAMINTNLQGNSATMSFTDTDHVTGVSLNEPTYIGATTSFIINDLKANKLDKTDGEALGDFTIPNATQVRGNGSDTSSTAFIGFMKPDNTTRLGYVGQGSTTDYDVAIGSDVGGIKIVPVGGKSTKVYRPLYLDGSYSHFTDGGLAALNMMNGDINGCNNIVFNDTSGSGEGIMFPKTGVTSGSTDTNDYNCFYALDGKVFLDIREAMMLQPRLAAGTDLNNVQEPGFYYSPANADNCVNVPMAGTAFSLLVEKHAGVKQTWTSYIGGTGTPRTFIRNYYQSWGNWFEMAYTPTMSLSGEDYSQTDFPANLKLVAENLWAGGFFGGGTYSFISYGEAHETNGRLQQSFNNYMDTQTAKWDNSWYTTTAQIMYTVTIPKFGNPDGSEFNVTVTDLNSTHKYNFVCEGDDPAIIKPALTTNEKGETQDIYPATKQEWTLDELGLDGTWVIDDVPGNIKKAYDKITSLVGFDTPFTIIQGLYNNVDAPHYEFAKALEDSLIAGYGVDMGTNVFEFSITFGTYTGTTSHLRNNTNFIKLKSTMSEFTRLWDFDNWAEHYWLDEKLAPHADVACEIKGYMNDGQGFNIDVKYRDYISGVTFWYADYDAPSSQWTTGDANIQYVPRVKTEVPFPQFNASGGSDTLFSGTLSTLQNAASTQNPVVTTNLASMYIMLNYSGSGRTYPNGIDLIGNISDNHDDVVLGAVIIHYGKINWEQTNYQLKQVTKASFTPTVLDTLEELPQVETPNVEPEIDNPDRIK